MNIVKSLKLCLFIKQLQWLPYHMSSLQRKHIRRLFKQDTYLFIFRLSSIDLMATRFSFSETFRNFHISVFAFIAEHTFLRAK